jgi:plastocyanin
MKKTSPLLLASIFSFIILFTVLIVVPTYAENATEPDPSQEVQIVKIRDVGYEGSLRIEPPKVTIPVGMVVVWVNMTRKAEPRIKFAEGMKCELSTEASADFKLDEQKCFITDYVQVGGSSSLKFIGPGTFNYHVENKTGQHGKGTIIVK